MCQELCRSDSRLPLSASGYSLHREYYLDLRVRSTASATVACLKYRTRNASRAVDEFSCCAFVDYGHPAAVAARHSLWMDATGVGASSISALFLLFRALLGAVTNSRWPSRGCRGKVVLPFLPVVCGHEGEKRRFGSEGLFGGLPGYHTVPGQARDASVWGILVASLQKPGKIPTPPPHPHPMNDFFVFNMILGTCGLSAGSESPPVLVLSKGLLASNSVAAKGSRRFLKMTYICAGEPPLCPTGSSLGRMSHTRPAPLRLPKRMWSVAETLCPLHAPISARVWTTASFCLLVYHAGFCSLA